MKKLLPFTNFFEHRWFKLSRKPNKLYRQISWVAWKLMNKIIKRSLQTRWIPFKVAQKLNRMWHRVYKPILQHDWTQYLRSCQILPLLFICASKVHIVYLRRAQSQPWVLINYSWIFWFYVYIFLTDECTPNFKHCSIWWSIFFDWNSLL
jgi:hypothetical protein